MNNSVLEKIKSIGDAMRKKSLTLIFIFIIIVIGILNLLVIQQINLFSTANNWVVHTYQVLQATNGILLNEYEAVSRERGYLLLGDESLLANIQTRVNAMLSDYALAKKLTIDNPEQQKKLNALGPLLNKKALLIFQAIHLKKYNELKSGDENNLIHSGQELTDQITTAIESINRGEFILLVSRTYNTEQRLNSTMYFVLFVDLISLLSLIVIIVLFHTQLSKQIKSKKLSQISESLLKGIINGTNDLIVAFDLDFKLIAYNQTWKDEIRQIYGKRVKTGMSIMEILGSMPADVKNAVDIWGRALKGEEFTVIGAFGNPDLIRNQYEITYSSIYNEQGKLIGASHIARNIVKRLEAEQAAEKDKVYAEKAFKELKQHDEEISLINEMSNILQSSTSLEETLHLIENYCFRLLPFTAGVIYVLNSSHNYLESLAEWNIQEIHEQVIFPEQCWGLRQGKIYHYSDKNKHIACKHTSKKVDISPYLCVPLLGQNEIVGLLYLEIKTETTMSESAIDELINQHELLITTIASHVSIAIANIKLRDALKIRSIRDPLTGLYNRLYLNESLGNDFQRAKRKNISLAIIMMDIDHFKEINDTYGHDTGDYVLKELGKLIIKVTRKSDIACRYGGEEFLLMYYDISQENALKAVEQLRVEINQMNLSFGSQSISNVSASFGISMYPKHGETPEEVISAADKALYQSKKDGRNKTTHYQKAEE